MGEEVKSGTVIPKPPVPSKVGTELPPIGNVPTSIEEGGEVGKEVVPKEEKVEEKAQVVERETEPSGVITIRVFKLRPFEVDFSGDILGKQLDLAWRYMMKQYKVWKHSERKEDENRRK